MSKWQWCCGVVVLWCCGGNADLEKNLFLEPSIHISLEGTFDFLLLNYFMYLAFKVEGDGHLNPFSPRVTNINFLQTISKDDQEKRLGELRKWRNKGEML